MPPSLMWTPCPECRQRSGTPLPMGHQSGIIVFECDDCGHIWEVPSAAEARQPVRKRPVRVLRA